MKKFGTKSEGELKGLPAEREIMQSWQDCEPIVSICCATYNHCKFIEDTLKGFLIQKTHFPFEILIHDDASIDGTANIIRSYAVQYKTLIKPILQSENQYCRGKKPNPKYNFPRARGKYIALCEGDDFWPSSNKLQKQYDFMETHAEIICCYHNADIIDTTNKIISKSKLPINQQRSHSSFDLMTGKALILTLTAFFRNIPALRDYPVEASKVLNGDKFLFSILGQYGAGGYLPDIENAVYRLHAGGIWSSETEISKTAAHLNTWCWLAEYYKRLGSHPLVERDFRTNCLRITADKASLITCFYVLFKRLRIGETVKTLIKAITQITKH